MQESFYVYIYFPPKIEFFFSFFYLFIFFKENVLTIYSGRARGLCNHPALKKFPDHKHRGV